MPIEYLLTHLRAAVANRSRAACSIEHLILDYGQSYRGQVRPKGIRKGRNKLCFQHAYLLATADNSTYSYVEGYAYDPNVGAAHHAWCAFGDLVIDRTWRNPEVCVYIGISIPKRLLTKIMNQTRCYGVLDFEIGRRAVEEWVISKAHLLNSSNAVTLSQLASLDDREYERACRNVIERALSKVSDDR